jgi:hypothetical protein
MVTVAIVASFIAASSNEHGSMSKLPKDTLAIRKRLAETDEAGSSEYVIATRQQCSLHSPKPTEPTVSGAIHRPIADFDLKRRSPVKDRGFGPSAEIVLRFTKLHACIEFLHELSIGTGTKFENCLLGPGLKNQNLGLYRVHEPFVNSLAKD